MSKQMGLGTGFEKYGKTTRRETFLTEMDLDRLIRLALERQTRRNEFSRGIRAGEG